MIFKIKTLIIITGLAACTTVQQPYPSSAERDLADSAISTSQSLQQLNLMQQNKSPIVVLEDSVPQAETYGMQRLATVNWIGTLEPLVVELARQSHYRVKTYGQEPAIPVIVSVQKQNEMIGNILTDATLQSRGRVDLIIYPDQYLIELRYLNS